MLNWGQSLAQKGMDVDKVKIHIFIQRVWEDRLSAGIFQHWVTFCWKIMQRIEQYYKDWTRTWLIFKYKMLNFRFNYFVTNFFYISVFTKNKSIIYKVKYNRKLGNKE